jgi:hypothetical protein
MEYREALVVQSRQLRVPYCTPSPRHRELNDRYMHHTETAHRSGDWHSIWL